MALDTDKDGKVSFMEASKYDLSGPAPLLRVTGQTAHAARTRVALALKDAAADELTLANFEAAGKVLFRTIDLDGDGKISRQELDDYRRKPTAKDGNP